MDAANQGSGADDIVRLLFTLQGNEGEKRQKEREEEEGGRNVDGMQHGS